MHFLKNYASNSCRLEIEYNEFQNFSRDFLSSLVYFQVDLFKSMLSSIPKSHYITSSMIRSWSSLYYCIRSVSLKTSTNVNPLFGKSELWIWNCFPRNKLLTLQVYFKLGRSPHNEDIIYRIPLIENFGAEKLTRVLWCTNSNPLNKFEVEIN